MSVELQCRTMGMADPKGRPRVFFSCHPADFGAFSSVADAIIHFRKNAAIWYYEPASGIPEGEEFFQNLLQMQLFVFPVTRDFLYEPNAAREVQLPFALENHIPVLPLLLEKGISQAFNNICGKLQYLDRYDDDPTSVSFEVKMKNYLESVLVSDEEIQEIRKAFDAYVFLSYRKKDRKYVAGLTKLIHDQPEFRDVAIWYDEYLTPGQDFSRVIADAMDRSSLVMLMITPGLLEEDNYVMKVEYPIAKRAGKTVLPIEVEETDRELLRTRYEGLGVILNPYEQDRIFRQLWEKVRSSVGRSDRFAPQQMYLMGLAYLSGIDVEVDHERALELITRAADSHLPKAYEKLVSMYENGEGVKTDHRKAALWQGKKVELLKQSIPEPYTSVALVPELMNLGDRLKELGEIAEAMQVYEDMLSWARKGFTQNPSDGTRRSVAMSLERIGNISMTAGNMEQARRCFESYLQLYLGLAEASKYAEDWQEVSIAYERLAEMDLREEKIEGARHFYEAALAIREQLAERMNSNKARRDLMVAYNNIGNIFLQQGDFRQAEVFCDRARQISERLVRETESQESLGDYVTVLMKMGNVLEMEGKIGEAGWYYDHAMRTCEDLVKEDPTPENLSNLALSLYCLGTLLKDMGDKLAADSCLRKALSIRKKLLSIYGTPQALEDLAAVYAQLGLLGDRGALERAFEIYVRLADQYPQIEKYQMTIQILLSKLKE